MVTVTSTVPAEPAGDVTMICVSPLTVIAPVAVAFATEPNFVQFAPVKPVPVMVTVVPPDVEPYVGEMPVTTGVGYNVTFNPLPVIQLKTGVSPAKFVPSVGNVAGREPVLAISVYVPDGIVFKRFTVIPELAIALLFA